MSFFLRGMKTWKRKTIFADCSNVETVNKWHRNSWPLPVLCGERGGKSVGEKMMCIFSSDQFREITVCCWG